MKNLELEQMEQIDGGAWNSCEWGMAGVGAFWSVAIAMTGVGVLAAPAFGLGWGYLTSEIC